MQCVQVISTGCTVAALKLRCTHLAVGSFNASAMLWTLPSGELLGRYVGHTSAVFSVDFNHFCDILVTGSAEVILWSLTNKTPIHSINLPFLPTSINLVFPSEIPHQSNTFMLAATDNEVGCHTFLVNCCNGNITVSNMKLPVDELTGFEYRLAAVLDDSDNNIVISCTGIFGAVEHCITLKCSVQTSESYNKFSSLKATEETVGLLDCHCRYISDAVTLGISYRLLAAGSRFSVYVSRWHITEKLLIVRHSPPSNSKDVGFWCLPGKCRWESVIVNFDSTLCLKKSSHF